MLKQIHRANEISAPSFMLLCTDIGGETRFVSAVARRMQSLGAMTSGDRKALLGGSTSALSERNVESASGKEAVSLTVHALKAANLELDTLLDAQRLFGHTDLRKEMIEDISMLLPYVHLPKEDGAIVIGSETQRSKHLDADETWRLHARVFTTLLRVVQRNATRDSSAQVTGHGAAHRHKLELMTMRCNTRDLLDALAVTDAQLEQPSFDFAQIEVQITAKISEALSSTLSLLGDAAEALASDLPMGVISAQERNDLDTLGLYDSTDLSCTHFFNRMLGARFRTQQKMLRVFMDNLRAVESKAKEADEIDSGVVRTTYIEMSF